MKNRRGFTLLESVITLSVMLIVFSTASVYLARGIKTWRQAVRKAANLQIKCLVAERICSETRAATGLIKYSYYAGKVRREKGGTAAYLSNEGEIMSLSLTKIDNKTCRVVLDDIQFSVAARN